MKNKLFKNFIKNSILCLSSSLALSWTTVSTVSDDNEISYAPITTINNTGNAIIVFANGTYPNINVQSSFYDGSSWSSPTLVAESGTHVNAICGIDSAGNVIAAWETMSGENRIIHTSVKLFESGWETPIIHSDSIYNTGVALAVNTDGQIILGWVDQLNNHIKAKTLTFEGSWSAVTIISSAEGYKGNLLAKINSSGDGILVWEDYSTNSIFASQTTAGFESEWSEPVQISSTGTNTGPTLSMNEAGNAIVAWTNIDDYSVSGAIYENSTWNADTLLSNDYAGYPSAAASETEYFVSWSDFSTGGTTAILYSDASWETPFLLSNEPLNDYPQSSFCSGKFITVWADINYGIIYALEYPFDNSSAAPVEISDGNDNIYPYNVNSSSSRTSVAWQSLDEISYLIKINTNTN